MFLQKAFQKESEEIREGVELAIPTYVFVSIFLLSSSIYKNHIFGCKYKQKITFSDYFSSEKSHFRDKSWAKNHIFGKIFIFMEHKDDNINVNENDDEDENRSSYS